MIPLPNTLRWGLGPQGKMYISMGKEGISTGKEGISIGRDVHLQPHFRTLPIAWKARSERAPELRTLPLLITAVSSSNQPPPHIHFDLFHRRPWGTGRMGGSRYTHLAHISLLQLQTKGKASLKTIPWDQVIATTGAAPIFPLCLMDRGGRTQGREISNEEGMKEEEGRRKPPPPSGKRSEGWDEPYLPVSYEAAPGDTT